MRVGELSEVVDRADGLGILPGDLELPVVEAGPRRRAGAPEFAAGRLAELVELLGDPTAGGGELLLRLGVAAQRRLDDRPPPLFIGGARIATELLDLLA